MFSFAKENCIQTPPIKALYVIFVGFGRITSNQGFYLLGLDNTTPTFASVIENAIPATTFIMAVMFR